MTGFLQRLAARAQGAETSVTVRQRARFEPGAVSYPWVSERRPSDTEADLPAENSSPSRTVNSLSGPASVSPPPVSQLRPSRATLRRNLADGFTTLAAQRMLVGAAQELAGDSVGGRAATVRAANPAIDQVQPQNSSRSTDLDAHDDSGEPVPRPQVDAVEFPADVPPDPQDPAEPNTTDRRDAPGNVDPVTWERASRDVNQPARPAGLPSVPEPVVPSDTDLLLNHVVPALIRAGVLARGEQVRWGDPDRADRRQGLAKGREPAPGTTLVTAGRPRRDAPGSTGESRHNSASQNGAAGPSSGSRPNSTSQGPAQVHVHIDRVEVVRATSPPPPPVPARREPPRVDHAAYLERRRADRR